MKKILIFIILNLIAFSITAQVFPGKAKKFIEAYYPEQKIAAIQTDRYFSEYEVILDNRVYIQFDKKGNLLEIKGSNINLNILPLEILNLVDIKFPDSKVIKYEIENFGKRYETYEITLDNGVELEFNKNFICIDIDYGD